MGQPMIAVTITPEELELLIREATTEAVRCERTADGFLRASARAQYDAHAQALRARAAELAALREPANV